MEIKALPGNVRQRVKRAIDALAGNPHPTKSLVLDAPESERKLCRLRLDRWPIVYAVTEAERAVDVLTGRPQAAAVRLWRSRRTASEDAIVV